MIQDILPDVLNNHYEHLKPESGDRVILFRKDRLLTRYDEAASVFVFPCWAEFRGDETAVYLFSVSGGWFPSTLFIRRRRLVCGNLFLSGG